MLNEFLDQIHGLTEEEQFDCTLEDNRSGSAELPSSSSGKRSTLCDTWKTQNLPAPLVVFSSVLGAKRSGCFSRQVLIFKAALSNSVKIFSEIFWHPLCRTNIYWHQMQCYLGKASTLNQSHWFFSPTCRNHLTLQIVTEITAVPKPARNSVSVGTTLAARAELWFKVMSNLQTFSNKDNKTWHKSNGELFMHWW